MKRRATSREGSVQTKTKGKKGKSKIKGRGKRRSLSGNSDRSEKRPYRSVSPFRSKLPLGKSPSGLNDRAACRSYLSGKCQAGQSCPYWHPLPCSRYIEGECKYGRNCSFDHLSVSPAPARGRAPTPPRTPQSRTKPWVVAARLLGVLAADLTNAGASMGTSLNPVQDSHHPAYAAGGDSSLVTKSFENSSYSNQTVTSKYQVCPGIKLDRNQLEPSPSKSIGNKFLDAKRGHVRT